MTPEAFWNLYGALFSLLGGACLGSFLNVCIARIPHGQSVVHPRSRCPKCERPIPWHENIPLLSFLLLRGRCRGCQAPISLRYPVVELLTAALFYAAWHRYGASPLTAIYMLMTFGLLLGTFVDLEHFILPDRVTIGGMILGLGLSAIYPPLHQAQTAGSSVLASAVGLGLGAGILQAVRLLGTKALRQEAMGFGDVKLLGAIGAFLGWKAVLFCLVAGSLAGSLVGIFLIAAGRRDWGGRLPFGPYLALAALLWIHPGADWFEAYLRWISPSGY